MHISNKEEYDLVRNEVMSFYKLHNDMKDPYVRSRFIQIVDLERSLLTYRISNNIYECGDDVVRLSDGKVYNVRKVESCGSILIARYPTPTKPSFTWVSHFEVKHYQQSDQV